MNILRFNKREETQYKLDSYKKNLLNIRITLLICIFFYSFFSLVDFIVDIKDPWLFFYIRFLIINPIFIFGLILSFHKSFYKIHQLVNSIAYIFAGLGIVAMMSLEPLNHSYYCGLFLIFATGHLITCLDFKSVSISSLIIIIAYVFASIFFINDINPLSNIYLIFYISFYILNVYGSYISTKYKRQKYNQVYILRDDMVVLEKENYDKLTQIEDSNRITTFSLAKLAEARDKLTGDHIERVGSFSLKLAVNLDEEIYKKNNVNKQTMIKSIELASTLHDIGKISIPEDILMKPGKLTDKEMDIMKTHAICGYEMLLEIYSEYNKNTFINMGLDICKYHHERWDGKGYPTGLAGMKIPLSARIVSIIDVYDALLHKRPYKEPLPLKETLLIIKHDKGKRFDPALVDAFLKLFN